MHQNIKINSVRAIDAKLYSAHYYDYMLYRGEVANQTLGNLDGMAIADFSQLHIVSGILYSTVLWSGATNSGVDMEDIGFTGVDNGLISYERDKITNEEFLNIYLNSTYSIESGDTRLFLSPITGNTQMYEYPMYLTEDEKGNKYIACKGGFYQGFFKLEGFDYQVLPNSVDNEWMMHFEIRPRSDYEVKGGTVNYTHPDNKGIFFFMGTRAENKFWPFYKTDAETTEALRKIDAQSEGYFDGCGEEGETYNINDNKVVSLENDWLREEFPEKKEEGYFLKDDGYYAFDCSEDKNEIIPIIIKPEGYFIKGDGYYAFDGMDDEEQKQVIEALSSKTDNIVVIKGEVNGKPTSFGGGMNLLNDYGYKTDNACQTCVDCKEKEEEKKPCSSCTCCEEYFNDEYYDNKCPEIDNNKIFEDEYIGSGVTINYNGDAYEDSEGHSFTKRGYYEIESDNKFLMFDRTPDGFTTHNWVEGTTVSLYGRKNWPNANYFLLMNRTPTGYTVHNIDQYNEENSYDYNLYKDVRNNVFALRVTENGAIGYRYGILNCDDDNPNRYEVIEEYSKDNMVKMDEWNSINVRFAVLNPSANPKCDTRSRKMRILIYVNGFLKFISKEIPAFRFKALDEVAQKQEAVPYSISLGGGSLGLLETILPNYYAISDYILPIERDFCGTFLGDIKSFKMYSGFINYSTIKNYLS